MAFGGRVTLRKRIDAGRIIGMIAMLVIFLYVGQTVLETVRDQVYDVNADYNQDSLCTILRGQPDHNIAARSCVANTEYTGGGQFATAFNFMGLGNDDHSGLVAVIALLAVAGIALQVIKINL